MGTLAYFSMLTMVTMLAAAVGEYSSSRWCMAMITADVGHLGAPAWVGVAIGRVSVVLRQTQRGVGSLLGVQVVADVGVSRWLYTFGLV